MQKKEWNVNSWRNFPIKQQPIYADLNKIRDIEDFLSKAPPLVYSHECERLKKQLALVSQRKAFLLQGGDCAESFREFSEENLRNYFRVILQMTVALMHGLNIPVVKVGRIAGQFAKPRSSDFEELNGQKLPSYRGDIVNSLDFNADVRKPDPENLVKAYMQSGTTLNFLRSLSSGGFSSLENINGWLEDFASNYVNSRKTNTKILEIINDIKKATNFIKSCGFNLAEHPDFNSAEFFSSHEGLLLNYESALTRGKSRGKKYYCCSAHMLWIGDRTRDLDGAHIEFFRGIENPLAVKVGPSMQKQELAELIKALNPNNEHGKLTLITRMGADKINDHLPDLVANIHNQNLNVIWSCDPMHGNTEKSSTGYKTRKFENIAAEVKSFFRIHEEIGSYPGGIHIEMTGQDVTECLGGAQDIGEEDLQNRYHTHCDPRLNGKQSLELAFWIAKELGTENK